MRKKIIGVTVGTTMLRPDWNQTDRSKSDYIKNKPTDRLLTPEQKTLLDNLEKNGVTDGEDGVGISSIEKTSTEGLVDTYTITLTDGSTCTFTVTNGEKGADGEDGQDGKTPKKGEDYFTEEDIEEIAGKVKIDSVDPSKVIFGETVYTAYAVGNIALENGKAVLAEKGDNLFNVMKNIWSKDVNPTTTQPSVTLTFSQWGSYEVGESVTPTYSVSFNKGSYSFDADTGVSVTKWIISDTKGNSHTYTIGNNGNWFRGTTDTGKSPSKGEHPSGSFPSFTVTDGISYKITAKAEHTAGSIPHTNMGEEYADGQITAGTTDPATSNAVTGYRNSFYGTLNSKDDFSKEDYDVSATIRNIKNGTKDGKSGKALSNGNSFAITIPASTTDKPIYRVLIAYPATLRDLTSVLDKNDSNSNIVSGFDGPNIFTIKGAGDDAGIQYKVYTMDFADPYDTANTFTVTI